MSSGVGRLDVYDEEFFDAVIADYSRTGSINSEVVDDALERFLATYPEYYGLNVSAAVFLGGINSRQIQGVRRPKKLLEKLFVVTKEKLYEKFSSRGINNVRIEGVFKVVTRAPPYFLLLLSTPRGYWRLFLDAAKRELESMSGDEIRMECVIPEVDLDASVEGDKIAFRTLKPGEVKDWLVMAINELRKILL